MSLYQKYRPTTFDEVFGQDEAVKVMKSIVKMPKEKRPHVFLFGGASGCGKCVTGDTLVYVNNVLSRIDDYDTDIEGFSDSVMPVGGGYFGVNNSSHFYKEYVHSTIKITNSLGMTIEGTPDHPLLTLDANCNFVFKKLKDITQNDILCVNRGAMYFPKEDAHIPYVYNPLCKNHMSYTKNSPEFGCILGHIIANGCKGSKTSVAYSSSKDEVIADFKKALAKYGMTLRPRTKEDTKDWRVMSVEFTDTILSACEGLPTARYKSVPKVVLNSGFEIQIAFIRALFDCDASYCKRRGCLEWCTASETLAQQVQNMLLNIGIVSRISCKYVEKYNYNYTRLSITGADCDIYKDLIGSVRFKFNNKKRNTNLDIIPNLYHALKSIYGAGKNGHYRYGTSDYTKPYFGSNAVVSRNKLSTLKEVVEQKLVTDKTVQNYEAITLIDTLIKAGFFYASIKSIEIDDTPKWVYDFTIPSTHAFYSNGYISHNTTMAKVFARAIGVDPDTMNFQTLDASKDRSIERIRELYDKLSIRPMGNKAEGRIFLLDECFDYNTPITCVDNNGKLFTEKIGSIVNGKKHYNVLSFNKETGVLEPKPITGWFENSKKPVKNYIFKRESGYEKTHHIACSDNHVIFMADGAEKEAGKLCIGDRVKVTTPWRKKYKHRSRRSENCYNISEDAYSFLLGTALGDSTLQKGTSANSTPRFKLIHSTKQADYFKEKVRLFGDAMGKYRVIKNKGYGDLLITGFSKSLQVFDSLYKELYHNGRLTLSDEVISKIDAIALTALYCDDGSWSPSKYTKVDGAESVGFGSCALSTHSFTKSENVRLAKHIRKRFGISMRLMQHKNTDMWYLTTCTKTDTELLMRTVAPWMPVCMQHKLHSDIVAGGGMSNITPITFKDSGFENSADIGTAVLVSIEDECEYQKQRGHLYDIEVADNHTYIANGVVVHNCHQLQKPAQEALLKMCEDTPASAYIIFATTEPDALGKALRSRCKTITIKPLTPKAIYQNLKRVSEAEGIAITDEHLQKIAQNSDNSARVSLQILETYMLNGNDVDKAISMNGGVGNEMKADTITLCRAIVDRYDNWNAVVDFCTKYKGQSEPIRQAILGYLKACLMKAENKTKRLRFASLIECFLEPHYDCGDVALLYQIATAFEVK